MADVGAAPMNAGIDTTVIAAIAANPRQAAIKFLV